MTMREQWRPVVGWEGFYDVSDLGRVRSKSRVVDVNGGKRAHTGQVLKQYVEGPYARVRLSGGGRIVQYRAHALVAEAFIGPRPDGMEVRHRDGDSLNNRRRNIAYSTHLENIQDKYDHGRTRSSVRGFRPIPEEKKREIPHLRKGEIKDWAERNEFSLRYVYILRTTLKKAAL